MNILCCGFFPALQRTIEFKAFRPYEVNRACKVTVAASGKVTNTARVLRRLGAEPRLLSFAGGANGQIVRDRLEAEGLSCRWIETRSETRICQTILSGDHDGCTELVENTGPLTAAEWKAFVKAFTELECQFDRIILSGTLPPHAPQDIYAELMAHTNGGNVLLDTHGAPLLAALEHRPALVKINAEELRMTIQIDDRQSGFAPVQELAHELMARGAGAVGITRGKESALLVTPDGTQEFSVPQIQALNPIGSGDAVNAGTAFALAKGHSLVEAFVFGLACGTSNAMNIEPGCVKLEQIAELVPQIKAQ